MQLVLLLQTMTPAYCSTALMADPLTRRRTAALAACLQNATLPFLAAAPMAKPAAGNASLLHGERASGRVVILHEGTAGACTSS